MALTFRDNNLAPLSYDEMDSNWRFFTGSFTNTGTITANAFAGDGSAITGVTGEWDGSHNGNASITGSLTVTGGVSSSVSLNDGETIEALNGGGQLDLRANNTDGVIVLNTSASNYASSYLYMTPGLSGEVYLQGQNVNNYLSLGNNEINIATENELIFRGSSIRPFGSLATDLGADSRPFKTTYSTTGSFLHLEGNPLFGSTITVQDSITFQSSITASGDISSSGLLYGLGLYASNFVESDLIRTPDLRTELISSQGTSTVSINDNLDVVGNITASGNISASGDMYSSMFRGEQLFLNSGSSQYLNTPAAGDVALIAMSGSGAFSTTSAIAPNNLVLFSEYKTGDTGTVNGKAASSILLTVNHGASNGNNAVAQIACVAQGVSSNYGDLVFSTRGLLDNVTERMRITQNKTTITGSLDVSGALSKGSGTFKIAHPISTGSLYHSFIEGPKCDLIYRGTTTLTNGVTDVNIDSVSNMTEGTFVALTQDPQLFLQNTTGWEPLKGSISGNILSIECKSTSSVDNVSWMVVAERADDFIKNWNLTDENGHLIPEQ